MIIFLFMIIGFIRFLKWDGIFTGLLGATIGFGVGIILCLPFSCTCNKTFILENTKYISCINDNTKIQGSYYLFSGNIDQQDIYKMYIIDSDGGKKLLTLDTEINNITLYEDDSTPRIEEYKEKYSNDIIKFLFGVPFSQLIEGGIYKIYIPQNSITTQYNIDLKDDNYVSNSNSSICR